jgi:hypothetical protein
VESGLEELEIRLTRLELAAFTMASTFSVVISPWNRLMSSAASWDSGNMGRPLARTWYPPVDTNVKQAKHGEAESDGVRIKARSGQVGMSSRTTAGLRTGVRHHMVCVWCGVV